MQPSRQVLACYVSFVETFVMGFTTQKAGVPLVLGRCKSQTGQVPGSQVLAIVHSDSFETVTVHDWPMQPDLNAL